MKHPSQLSFPFALVSPEPPNLLSSARVLSGYSYWSYHHCHDSHFAHDGGADALFWNWPAMAKIPSMLELLASESDRPNSEPSTSGFARSSFGTLPSDSISTLNLSVRYWYLSQIEEQTNSCYTAIAYGRIFQLSIYKTTPKALRNTLGDSIGQCFGPSDHKKSADVIPLRLGFRGGFCPQIHCICGKYQRLQTERRDGSHCISCQ